ncbi:DsbA family protein [Alloalcanivorax mobilis]|uniref:DsbA family protein n=1 Tax=Alloalcanivorax mobilis TaxID=2019569 RepID=UPI000C77158A|nr:DsbA family protein [Alloalcanivorax mobilis]
MSLKHALMPFAAGLITSPARQRWRHRLADWRRRLAGRPRQATFYFRLDDPYSWLLAQALPAFSNHFALAIRPRVLLYLDRQMYPEPEMLEQLAIEDAARLARFHGLRFPGHAQRPDPRACLAATRCLLRHEGDERFWSLAHALAGALWEGDHERLANLIAEHGQQPEDQARLALEARRDQFIEDGHYLSATLHYQGEWYWSLERLDHLARQLEHQGLGGGAWPLDYGAAKRPRLDRPPAAPGTRLVLYFSFRSPYSYLALQRACALADHYRVALEFRPVLPMVMRGLAVPRAKRFYILTDAAREARLHGVPFGRVCDPVGRGVERCMALWPFAEKEGRLREWLLAAATGIWSQGVDAASDAGLKRLAENAGLDWNRARRWLDDDQWRQLAQANRDAMMAAGSWGVPTFQIGDTALWGQDRLALVEQALQNSDPALPERPAE